MSLNQSPRKAPKIPTNSYSSIKNIGSAISNILTNSLSSPKESEEMVSEEITCSKFAEFDGRFCLINQEIFCCLAITMVSKCGNSEAGNLLK
jgi:hypothetical protein